MLTILAIASASINLLLITIRLAECIYELKKKPELDTIGEIIQVFKNFFKIEKYDSNKEE